MSAHPIQGILPDLKQAERYIEALTGDAQTPVTFQTFDDSPLGRGSLARVLHGPLSTHAEALTRLSLEGAGVFMMVNEGDGVIHAQQKTCRTNSNVTRIRALFVDLDGSPLQPVLASGATPTLVVQSSPGRWHVYWNVTDTALSEFGPAQSALANLFDSDRSVKDLARVMRLPGFVHQKGEPFMTTIVDPPFNVTDVDGPGLSVLDDEDDFFE